MPTTLEGNLIAEGLDVAIVAARWNDAFGQDMLDGAIDALERHGASEASITVVRCPGSFELPQVAHRVAQSFEVDAIVCIGVLIRGETPHFDYIAGESTSGIGGLGLDLDVPVSFGVLTCDTMKQARARSGSKAGNKGEEAAMAAVEMANLYDALDDYDPDRDS